MKGVRIDLVGEHFVLIFCQRFASHKLTRETFRGLEVGQIFSLFLLQLDDLWVLTGVLVHKVLFSWDPENSEYIFVFYLIHLNNLCKIPFLTKLIFILNLRDGKSF